REKRPSKSSKIRWSIYIQRLKACRKLLLPRMRGGGLLSLTKDGTNFLAVLRHFLKYIQMILALKKYGNTVLKQVSHWSLKCVSKHLNRVFSVSISCVLFL